HQGYSIEESVAFISSRDGARQRGEDYSFAVFDAVTERFLGGVGVNQINRIHRMANLGYWIRQSETGRGAATAATLLAARYGFQELGLQRIEIVAAIGNVASQKVARKAGARKEGARLRKRLLINGEVQDAVLFSLIAEDLKNF
ncbi:MAG: GNAT family N-acetyltransferase, partial [Pyrinomonadaceae bacterium]|nr:GNAT family N-acetyltransferase [Pyrinomonadaceae bacterium]